MVKNFILCVVTFVLAFCSISYELLLGQALTAFLGNTVLRYSVTVGLYLLSMGIGAYFAEGRFIRYSVLTLLWIEFFLALLGGTSIIGLHLLHALQVGDWSLLIYGHVLIIAIGILSGFEIPLLMALWKRKNNQEAATVLGVNYIGAFIGTVVFALWFYPILGLVGTAFFIALCNACTAILFALFSKEFRKSKRSRFLPAAAMQPLVAICFLVAFYFYPSVEQYLVELYISVGIAT